MNKPKSKTEASTSDGRNLSASPGNEIMSPAFVSANIKQETLDNFRVAILEHYTLAITASVNALMRRIECGALLYEARKIVPPKGWERWLDVNFSAETGFCIRTAQRYVQDYEKFRQKILPRVSENAEAISVPSQNMREILIEYCKEKDEEREPRTSRSDADQVNQFISPKAVIDPVETVLGSIDYDPCSSSSPQAVMLAKNNLKVADDGLAADRPWIGTAWIAPGHQGDFSPWAQKAVTEFEAGRLTDAILCLPVTSLKLPPQLRSCPIGISRSPLTVGYPKDEGVRMKRLKTPSLFIYLSRTPDVEKFAKAFHDIAVVFAVDHARPNPFTPK
jgi:hypothetical protein